MAYVPVTFFVKDPDGDPLEGVVLVVFSQDISTRYLEGTSSSEGKIQGLIPDDRTYELRYFYPQVRTGVLRLQVPPQDIGSELEVEVEVSVRKPEDATDPLFCNVYEHFRGDPFQGASVELRQMDRARVAGRSLLLPQPGIKQVGKDGKFSQVLPRGMRVQLSLPGTDALVVATVPDLPSIRLSDLFFPYLKEMGWESSQVELTAGQEAEVPLEVRISDGSTPPLSEVALQWVASPGLNYQVVPGAVKVWAEVAGTYTLSASLPDGPAYPEGTYIGRNPVPVVKGNPLTVVVA